MLEIIIIVLVVLWFFGLLGHVAGAFINILLVAAVIAAIYYLVNRSRR